MRAPVQPIKETAAEHYDQDLQEKLQPFRAGRPLRYRSAIQVMQMALFLLDA